MRQDLIKQFVIGFGFLNGLLFHIGIHPASDVVAAILPYLANMPNEIYWLFTVLPVIIMAFTLWYVFDRGGLLGLLSVALGFFGGYLIWSSAIQAIASLFAGIILGAMSFRGRR